MTHCNMCKKSGTCIDIGGILMETGFLDSTFFGSGEGLNENGKSGTENVKFA